MSSMSESKLSTLLLKRGHQLKIMQNSYCLQKQHIIHFTCHGHTALDQILIQQIFHRHAPRRRELVHERL